MLFWNADRIRHLKIHRHKHSLLRLADDLGVSPECVREKLADLDAANRRGRDFREFYLTFRCEWSPPDPGRIYTLCVRTLLKEYAKWLTLTDLIWHAKVVLFRTFGDYDPTKYRGGLRQEDNFVNLFMQRIRSRLHRHIRPKTDRGKRGCADKFPHIPALGLVNERAASGRDWAAGLVDTLPEALLRLDDEEYQVIYNKYMNGKSFAAIGRLMGLGFV